MTALNLRFVEKQIYEKILESAKKNRRSLNSEILWAIEYYLEHSPEAKKQEEPKEEKTTK